jgi:hypothetical protein
MSSGKNARSAYSRGLALMVAAGIVASIGAALLPDTEGKMYLALRLKCFFINLLDDQSNSYNTF